MDTRAAPSRSGPRSSPVSGPSKDSDIMTASNYTSSGRGSSILNGASQGEWFPEVQRLEPITTTAIDYRELHPQSITSILSYPAGVAHAHATFSYYAMEPEISTQQDTQCTQIADDPRSSSQESPRPVQPLSWARLITKGSGVTTYELHDIPPDPEGRHNLYTIGRSSSCAVRFDMPRISNKHCLVYCKMNHADRSASFLEAWIEDISANGTYLIHNGRAQRLTKGTARLLRTGDEISLINPDFAKSPINGVSFEDIQRNSFVVMVDLPPRPGLLPSTRSLRSNTISKQFEESLSRNNTVVRLLHQQRNVYDHYEFRELLGSGAAGRVFRATKKDTGEDYAIKVIDTRKLDLGADPTSAR